MENTKAKQIVADMINFFFVNEGLPKPILFSEVMERLPKYSLKEMVEASEIIRNSEPEKYISEEDGREYTRHMMNLDDRLIAAIYTFIHYHNSPSDDCTPIVSFEGKGLYKVH